MINECISILNRIAHRIGGEKLPMRTVFTPKCDLIADDVLDLLAHNYNLYMGCRNEVLTTDYVGPLGNVIGVQPDRLKRIYKHAYSDVYNPGKDFFLTLNYPEAFFSTGFGTPVPEWNNRVAAIKTMLAELEPETVFVPPISPLISNLSTEITHRRVERYNRDEPYTDTTETYTADYFIPQNSVSFSVYNTTSQAKVSEVSYTPRLFMTNPYSREMVFYFYYALIPVMGVSLSGTFDANYTNVPVTPIVTDGTFNNTEDQNTFNVSLNNVIFRSCEFTLFGGETLDITEIAVPNEISISISEELIQETLDTILSLASAGNNGTLAIKNSYELKPYLMSGYFT